MLQNLLSLAKGMFAGLKVPPNSFLFFMFMTLTCLACYYNFSLCPVGVCSQAGLLFPRILYYHCIKKLEEFVLRYFMLCFWCCCKWISCVGLRVVFLYFNTYVGL